MKYRGNYGCVERMLDAVTFGGFVSDEPVSFLLHCVVSASIVDESLFM